MLLTMLVTSVTPLMVVGPLITLPPPPPPPPPIVGAVVAVVVGVVVVVVVGVVVVVVVGVVVVVVVGVVVVVVVGVVVVPPLIVTWLLTTVTLMDCPLISPTMTFERLRVLVPCDVPAVIVITANVPALDTVLPGVVMAPATPVTVPVVLLTVPCMK
jgi:hypothetical protein